MQMNDKGCRGKDLVIDLQIEIVGTAIWAHKKPKDSVKEFKKNDTEIVRVVGMRKSAAAAGETVQIHGKVSFVDGHRSFTCTYKVAMSTAQFDLLTVDFRFKARFVGLAAVELVAM